ncbi:MAG TPA: hypothetical protein VEV83_15415 [Parafilimonas sp.]|nr:hypothetical protein [Parafilimonas sp.]
MLSTPTDIYGEYVDRNYEKLQREKRINSAVYNPINEKIYLEDPYYGTIEQHSAGKIPWDKYPWISDYKRYRELEVALHNGSVNEDQAKYNFINPEFQDEALRYNEKVEQYGAGVITSTEFPAYTVTSVSQELINMEQLERVKYNLLSAVKVINTDQLVLRFPRWTDTTQSVKSGYKENDPIDTIQYGAITEQQITTEKAGVGFGFTEEYYMRQFTLPIESFIMSKIAFDFTRVRHNQVLAALPSFPDVTGNDWGAYTAANIMSTNRPAVNLNTVKVAIMSNKLYKPDTIISNEAQYIDYETNTWVKGGLIGPMQASNRTQDDILTGVTGIPWLNKWILNEDIAADRAYIFDSSQMIFIEGPRKTTQAQLVNPDQTVEFRKEWFKFQIFDTAAGRELVSI